MIEIAAALAQILAEARPRPPISCPLAEATGKVLARPATNPHDIPPFDKALMDGYAVRAADIRAAETELPVVGTVMAGDGPPTELPPSSAVLIMTGAVLPRGADAVVIREQTTERSDEGGRHVLVQQFPVQPEQNLMRQGTICRAGQDVLPVDRLLTAADIGVLAETGHAEVEVVPRPRVAVLATGNELVPVEAPLEAGQIRNSNGPMLTAMAAAVGCPVTDLGIGRDDRAQLGQLIQAGLTHDVLVLSGGVSAGDLDLVPELLQAAHVTEVFHKVRLKPGKPMWFGVATDGTLVFGLPGNPVSSFVCFRLFVEPALRGLAGQPASLSQPQSATLASHHSQRGDRPTYFPSQVRRAADGHWALTVLPWQGSADLHTFTQANCLALFPAGESQFEPGQSIEFLPLSVTV